MNQNIRKYFSVFLFAGLLFAREALSDCSWSNISTPTNISDTNFCISGDDIHLNKCGTSIEAINNDVTITIESDSVIKGNKHGPSQLYLCASENHTITFDLTQHNLTFEGSHDSDKNPLLIVVTGCGKINFNLRGGHNLELSSSNNEVGGVRLYLLMEDPSYLTGDIPTLSFNRFDTQEYVNQELLDECDPDNSTNKDVHVKVGSHCLISYLSRTPVSCAQDVGCIQFNPTNNGNGRMILDIDNQGGVIIKGHKLKGECEPCTRTVDQSTEKNVMRSNCIDSITCACIDTNCATGYDAIFQVIKNTPYCIEGNFHAGLQIRNKNNTLFDLLIDPFFNLRARCDIPDYNAECECSYKGSFSGKQYGFVLGANGTVDIQSGSYLDYVALKNNLCPNVTDIPGHEHEKCANILKSRNPSAFWVDGNHNPNATPAQILLGDCSGLFFRSGVDKNGDVCYASDYVCWGDHSFTVDACDKTCGAGEYVFIVEAPLNVYGSNQDNCQKSKIEIFSLHVNPTGGTLFSELEECYDCQNTFPKRSFGHSNCASDGTFRGEDKDSQQGPLFRYNKAAFLINSSVNIFNTSLSHTDENHLVLEKNDLKSEPTYVGGESWWLSKDFGKVTCDGIIDPCTRTQTQNKTNCDTNICLPTCETLPCRPHIALLNSNLNIHTDIAITGMDLTTPNLVNDSQEGTDNISRMIFYYNGKCIDQGTGRNMVLGTVVGSTACNSCTVISRDAHVDVIQTENCETYYNSDQILLLETAANTSDINNNITRSIYGQFGINTIFLGHDSNISIGSHASCDNASLFDYKTDPQLKIDGNYFSFNARGGSCGSPASSHITGKGGIFVDQNGIFTIGSSYRAVMGTMVTRSLNGIINLPPQQVVFTDFTGIADWNINLSDQSQQILIGSTENISDYTFNWVATQKDYCNHGAFMPYALPNANMCSCPPVSQANVTSLPTIQGMVDQFQIQGARIGDEPTILIDGGYVRELLFFNTGLSGEAPVAIVVLQNHGRLGVNSNQTTPDSLFGATTFGINGLTIIANGDGRVDMNTDMVIDNRCAFIKGPDFNANTDLLEIYSDVARSLIVKSSGILDLQSFGPGDTIQFGGQMRIIFEPGARIIMGGGTLVFANDVAVEMDQFISAKDFFILTDGVIAPDPTGTNPDYSAFNVGAGLVNTDDFRVKFIGTGIIELHDDAQMYIDKDTFVGIETYVDDQCEIPTTNITIDLQDNSFFGIGGDLVAQGGSFQIGNTQDHYNHTVTFSLVVSGLDARFRNGPQGFLGLNVGIVDRQNDLPNDWLVDVLYNVSNITINLIDGSFENANIYAGNDPSAHLLALGEESDDVSPEFTLIYQLSETLQEERVSNANVKGGGNIVRINRGAGAFKPIVLETDDITPNPNMRVGILASLPLLPNEIPADQTADEFFDDIKTDDGTTDITSRDINLGDASIETQDFSGITTPLRVGYIDRGQISRISVYDLIDINNGTQPDRVRNAADRAGVSIGVDLNFPPADSLILVTQLQ